MFASCSLCRDLLFEGVVLTGCGNLFHGDCLSEYAHRNRAPCPCCKTLIAHKPTPVFFKFPELDTENEDEIDMWDMFYEVIKQEDLLRKEHGKSNLKYYEYQLEGDELTTAMVLGTPEDGKNIPAEGGP